MDHLHDVSGSSSAIHPSANSHSTGSFGLFDGGGMAGNYMGGNGGLVASYGGGQGMMGGGMMGGGMMGGPQSSSWLMKSFTSPSFAPPAPAEAASSWANHAALASQKANQALMDIEKIRSDANARMDLFHREADSVLAKIQTLSNSSIRELQNESRNVWNSYMSAKHSVENMFAAAVKQAKAAHDLALATTEGARKGALSTMLKTAGLGGAATAATKSKGSSFAQHDDSAFGVFGKKGWFTKNRNAPNWVTSEQSTGDKDLDSALAMIREYLKQHGVDITNAGAAGGVSTGGALSNNAPPPNGLPNVNVLDARPQPTDSTAEGGNPTTGSAVGNTDAGSSLAGGTSLSGPNSSTAVTADASPGAQASAATATEANPATDASDDGSASPADSGEPAPSGGVMGTLKSWMPFGSKSAPAAPAGDPSDIATANAQAESSADSAAKWDSKVGKMQQESNADLVKKLSQTDAFVVLTRAKAAALLHDTATAINTSLKAAKDATDKLVAHQFDVERQLLQMLGKAQLSQLKSANIAAQAKQIAQQAAHYTNRMASLAQYSQNAAGQAMAAQMAQAMGFPIAARGVPSPMPRPDVDGEVPLPVIPGMPMQTAPGYPMQPMMPPQQPGFFSRMFGGGANAYGGQFGSPYGSSYGAPPSYGSPYGSSYGAPPSYGSPYGSSYGSPSYGLPPAATRMEMACGALMMNSFVNSRKDIASSFL